MDINSREECGVSRRYIEYPKSNICRTIRRPEESGLLTNPTLLKSKRFTNYAIGRRMVGVCKGSRARGDFGPV